MTERQKSVSIRNPLVWLRRLPYRRGYGVHSPFAYDLLTQVIYSPGRYYDYQQLDAQFSRGDRILLRRRVAVDRLLFRLANRWQPSLIYAPDASERALNYLRRGCRRAEFTDTIGEAELVYLSGVYGGMPEGVSHDTLLVVDHLRKNCALWRDVLRCGHASITFDLYDVGVAVFNPHLQRQDYIINW